MKKILLALLLVVFFAGTAIDAKAASTAYNAQIRTAINKYKMKNYVGCIQDLQIIEKKDPSNAVVHYYLANAYMKIGDKGKAETQFDKVISINSASALTSYSIQAKNCLNGQGDCEYVKLSPDQVPALISDPTNYLNLLKEQKTVGTTNPKDIEIEKLIKGKYNSNIHPEANRIIIDALLKQEKHDMNVSTDKMKSEAPTNDEIAEAVKVLAKAGLNPIQANPTFNPYANLNQNNDYASLSMMFGNNQQPNNNNNNFMNMLPFIMQQSQQGGNKQMSTEMIQAMMTSQMMPDFNFDSNPKY